MPIPTSAVKRRLLCLMFCLFLHSGLWNTLTAERPSGARQVYEDVWTSHEGAPSGANALAQTADGLLWLGGPSGLFRFDGLKFERFQPATGSRLLSTNIFSLYAIPGGGLWVGYAFGGASLVVNGHITNYNDRALMESGTITSFAQDGAGPVWAMSSGGLSRFNGVWERIEIKDKSAIGIFREIRFDHKGVLWLLATKPQLTHDVRDTSVLFMTPGAKSFRLAGRLDRSFLTLDSDGKVVTTAYESEVLRDRQRDLPLELPVLQHHGRWFLDRLGYVWQFSAIASTPVSRSRAPLSWNGAAMIGRKAILDTHGSIALASSFLVDREGNIWFSVPEGLRKFFYTPFRTLGFPSAGQAVMVAEDRGAVLTESNAAIGSPLCETTGIAIGRCLTTQRSHGMQTAYRARDGSYWFANDTGIWHYAGKQLTLVRPPVEMVGLTSYVQAFAEDHNGGLWVSFGRHGQYRVQKGVWVSYGGLANFPKVGVITEYADPYGRVWFGSTNNQLVVVDREEVRLFGSKDGLRVGNVTAIQCLGSDIWIGGEYGLQRFDGAHFQAISAVNDDWLLGISGIVALKNGDVWVNGLSGVTHLPQQELVAGTRDPTYKVAGLHFGEREGAPGIAAQIRPLPTAIQGSDGRLWFSGGEGVRWVDPTDHPNAMAPQPIFISGLSADGKIYDLTLPLEVPAHTSEVRITFASISLSDPSAVRFRYKLQELDDKWHVADTAIPVQYQNLGPGSYHFNVNASDRTGIWSSSIATAAFTILPAWYQTWWFRSSIGLLICALVVLVYRLRIRSISRAISTSFNERLEERTRMARELHDTFLQTVQGSKMVADDALAPETNEERMRSALEKLSVWLGQAVTEGRAALHALRASATEQNELAGFLGRLLKEQCPSSLSVSLSIIGDPRALHPIVRDEVSLIAREAVRNACLHSNASQLRVELRYAESLRLSCEDDGIGMDPDVLAEGKSGHFGVQGMRERSARIHAKISIASSRNKGTAIVLKVPGEVAYRANRRGLQARLVQAVASRRARGEIL